MRRTLLTLALLLSLINGLWGTEHLFSLPDGRRIYVDCSFDCVDESLEDGCVYLGCSFEVTGDRLMRRSGGTGTVFLNCSFIVKNGGTLYLTGDGGQVSLVDCRFEGDEVDVVLTHSPVASAQCFQSGLTCDGEDLVVKDGMDRVVEMDGTKLLDAYKFEYAGRDYYNVYNLLGGYDGWDPMNMADTLHMAEKYHACRLEGLPVYISLQPGDTAVVGDAIVPVQLSVRLMSGGYVTPEFVGWSTQDESVMIGGITRDGCFVSQVNPDGEQRVAFVEVATEYGLEAMTSVMTMPGMLPAPEFESRPEVRWFGGKYRVKYGLKSDGLSDRSRIVWYSSLTPDGRYGLTKVGESDANNPCYAATEADVGRYIVARVDARSDRSGFGAAASAVSARPVNKRKVRR